MDNTALAIVQTRLAALLTAIQVGSPLAALFAHVYEDGETIDQTSLPLAAIMYGGEQVAETTRRMMMTMPFGVLVLFDVTSPEKPAARCAFILGELKAALLAEANRQLPGVSPAAAAIDIRYVGGGNEIVELSEEAGGNKWGMIADFEVDYRHLTTDPTSVL